MAGKEPSSAPYHFRDWYYQVQLFRLFLLTLSARRAPLPLPALLDHLLLQLLPLPLRLLLLLLLLLPLLLLLLLLLFLPLNLHLLILFPLSLWLMLLTLSLEEHMLRKSGLVGTK